MQPLKSLCMMLLRTASVPLPSTHSSLSDTYAASTGATAFWFQPSAFRAPHRAHLHIKGFYFIYFFVRDAI